MTELSDIRRSLDDLHKSTGEVQRALGRVEGDLGALRVDVAAARTEAKDGAAKSDKRLRRVENRQHWYAGAGTIIGAFVGAFFPRHI
jgi:hypothetical protein